MLFLHQILHHQHALQQCLDNSASRPVAGFIRGVEKRTSLWMPFMKRERVGNTNSDVRGFSIFVPSPKNPLGENCQRVIRVHAGVCRLPGQGRCDNWWVLDPSALLFLPFGLSPLLCLSSFPPTIHPLWCYGDGSEWHGLSRHTGAALWIISLCC